MVIFKKQCENILIPRISLEAKLTEVFPKESASIKLIMPQRVLISISFLIFIFIIVVVDAAAAAVHKQFSCLVSI